LYGGKAHPPLEPGSHQADGNEQDFSAHSNYCELALRELGYHSVFAHCGHATEINLHGKRVFPLVTGTFGGVDFL